MELNLGRRRPGSPQSHATFKTLPYRVGLHDCFAKQHVCQSPSPSLSKNRIVAAYHRRNEVCCQVGWKGCTHGPAPKKKNVGQRARSFGSRWLIFETWAGGVMRPYPPEQPCFFTVAQCVTVTIPHALRSNLDDPYPTWPGITIDLALLLFYFSFVCLLAVTLSFRSVVF